MSCHDWQFNIDYSLRVDVTLTKRTDFQYILLCKYISQVHFIFLEMSSLSPYTCITCHIAFNNGELQRAHYKTDWHRYNLKRKVADLGPITANEFTEKVEAIQQHSEKNIDANNRTSLTCKDCGKAFTSENGLLNHVKSKKHIDTVNKNANLPVSKKQ